MIYNDTLIQELRILRADMDQNDQDLFISIYGYEGSGKSTFAINLLKELDPTFSANVVKDRVARTLVDFARKVTKTGPLEGTLWDEAHRFSSRGMYDATANRDLLEYFQDIRGAKRIFALCYPDIKEMDRYVTKHRSRLFFETIKKGNKFWVRGWRKDQILAILDTMRLYKGKSKKDRWKGIPKQPVMLFQCDYRGIEAEMEEYKKIKSQSLSDADSVLRAKYAYYNLMDIVREVIQVTDYSQAQIQNVASKVVQKAAEGGWKDQIFIQNNRYTITDDDVFQNLVEDTLTQLPRPRISDLSDITTKDIVSNQEAVE